MALCIATALSFGVTSPLLLWAIGWVSALAGSELGAEALYVARESGWA